MIRMKVEEVTYQSSISSPLFFLQLKIRRMFLVMIPPSPARGFISRTDKCRIVTISEIWASHVGPLKGTFGNQKCCLHLEFPRPPSRYGMTQKSGTPFCCHGDRRRLPEVLPFQFGSIQWMDEILHPIKEPMVETTVCWHLQRNHHFKVS